METLQLHESMLNAKDGQQCPLPYALFRATLPSFAHTSVELMLENLKGSPFCAGQVCFSVGATRELKTMFTFQPIGAREEPRHDVVVYQA